VAPGAARMAHIDGRLGHRQGPVPQSRFGLRRPRNRSFRDRLLRLHPTGGLAARARPNREPRLVPGRPWCGGRSANPVFGVILAVPTAHRLRARARRAAELDGRSAAGADVLRHARRVATLLMRRRSRQELARRLRALGDCAACGHPWSEHLGSGNDVDGACGEGAYEFEHGQRELPEPGCTLPSPPR
jgi:hypothetical protein